MGKFCASALLISALVAVCFFSNVYADWGVVPGINTYYPLKIRMVRLDAELRWDVDERLLADVTALYVFSVGESVEAWQFYGYSYNWRFPSSVKWFQPIPPNSSNLDVCISDVPMQWRARAKVSIIFLELSEKLLRPCSKAHHRSFR